MKLAGRLDRIEPFYVMELAKAAARMAASPACDPAQGGRRMIRLNVGEPDFGTPDNINEAAIRAIHEGDTHYSMLDGSPALKAAVAEKFRRENSLDFAPEQIVVTAGAKMLLFCAFFATIQKGDEALSAMK